MAFPSLLVKKPCRVLKAVIVTSSIGKSVSKSFTINVKSRFCDTTQVVKRHNKKVSFFIINPRLSIKYSENLITKHVSREVSQPTKKRKRTLY